MFFGVLFDDVLAEFPTASALLENGMICDRWECGTSSIDGSAVFLETPVQDTVSSSGGDWRSDPVPTVMLNWMNYHLREQRSDTMVVNAISNRLARNYEILML
jgi:hypothetical protein